MARLGSITWWVLLTVLGAWAFSPWLGGDPWRWWLADLAASWVALVPPIALGLAVVAIARPNRHRPPDSARGTGRGAGVRAAVRRRVVRGPVLLASGLALVPLVPLLAHRTLLPPKPEPLAGGSLSVLVVNALGNNAEYDALARSIARSGAGVVALLEPPVPLQRGLREPSGGSGAREMRGVYPYVLRRPWVDGELDPAFLFSVWPMDAWPREPGTGTGAEREILGAIVRRPDADGGPFVVLMTHPDSPRTLDRYRHGWAVVEAFAQAALDARARGLPVILAADLNAGPAAGWSRALVERTGLRRSKPFLVPAGTFPAAWPWPAQIAIDDVWVSEEWRVLGWARLAAGRSDHHPVMAEIGPAVGPEMGPEIGPEIGPEGGF